jgi:hypothetical protein
MGKHFNASSEPKTVFTGIFLFEFEKTDTCFAMQQVGCAFFPPNILKSLLEISERFLGNTFGDIVHLGKIGLLEGVEQFMLFHGIGYRAYPLTVADIAAIAPFRQSPTLRKPCSSCTFL